MTPAQARAFLAVATQGSFTAAAKLLNVSQPTVTGQVRLIEKQYKLELFHRKGRSVRLTAAGATLLPILRRMFASFEEAVSYLEDFRGLRQGHLRVGSYGPFDVTALVVRYRERFSAISISVDFGNSRTLADKLRTYDLDVAVLERIEPHPEFHVLPFRIPLLVAIAPRTDIWARRKSISIDELRDQTLIRREPGSATRAAFDRLVGSEHPPHRWIEFGSREGVLSAVAEGLGIGAIFDDGVTLGSRVTKLTIVGAAVSSKVDVVCLAERRTSQLISAFLAVAMEYLREQPASDTRVR